MKRVVMLGMILFAFSVSAAWAQEARESWDNLKRLQVGQKIEVVNMDLKSVKGTFVSYAEDGISVQTGSGSLTTERSNVLRISLREHSKRARNALIGAAVGVAAGVGLMEREAGYAGAVAGTVVFVAAVGAGVGAAFPGSRTIYRAPRR